MDFAKGLVVYLYIGLRLITVAADGYPPTIIQFTIPNAVDQGSRILSSPEVLNVNPSDIRFYKDGNFITTTILKKTAELSDSGTYWIVANNSQGSVISDKHVLNVNRLTPWTDSGSVDTKRVEEGGFLIIDLPNIDSYPQPGHQATITKWFKNSTNGARTEIASSPNYYITASKQLIMLDIPLADNGSTVQAHFSNILLDNPLAISKSFLIQVTGRAGLNPVFVQRLPETTYVMPAVPVSLECVANARIMSGVTIKWFKQAGASGPRQELTNNIEQFGRRLSMVAYSSGDAIECEASVQGEPSVTSRTILSEIVSPAFITRMNSVYEVELDVLLALPCAVSGNPAPKITWYKNAEPLQTGNRLVISPNGTLTLYRVTLTDAGVYQCIADNLSGLTARSQTHVKLISSPPTITNAFLDQSAIEGSDLSILCTVNGKPIPDVVWTFRSSLEGVVNSLGNGGRFTINTTGLTIRQTQSIDSGVYSCKANNSLGVAEKSSTLVIYNRTTIKTDPSIYPSEEERGSSTSRSCVLNKDKRVTATILWYKDNAVIEGNTPSRSLVDNNQTLQFSQLETATDQGAFTCKVFSSAGNDTRTYNILIIQVPLKPEVRANLSAQTNRAILIQWKAPYNGNRPILYYNIRVSIDGGDWLNLSRNVPASSENFLAEGLRPSKNYRFIVTAINNLGEGQWSEPTISVQVPAEPPSAPPVIVDLDPLSSTSVRVRWTPPETGAWNGDLLGYKIQYQLHQQSSNPKTATYTTDSRGQTLLTYEIAGLLPYTDYWVRMAAFNIKGDGIYTEFKRVTTSESLPTRPPVIQSVVASSSTSCRLVWERPDLSTINGQTKGYHIKAYKGSDLVPSRNLSTEHSPDSASQTATVNDLLKFTDYRISVSLYTSAGESPNAWSNCTTEQDVPDAVDNPIVTSWTHNSISVSWNPPNIKNGVLTGYKVQIVGAGNDSMYEFTPLERSVVLSGLLPSTRYVISVSARTIKGYGTPVDLVNITRPPPQPPSPPTNLVDRDVDQRSVVLRFQIGADGQAPITHWIVQVKNETYDTWKSIANIKKTSSSSPGASDELTVQNLKPFSTYYFRLMAQNIAGLSNASEPTLAVQTKPAPPNSPPTNISIRAQNHSSLIINWEPIDLIEFNGEDCGYIVHFKSEYEISARVMNVTNPLTRFFILGGLTAYTSYSVEISAANRLYESSRSPPVVSRTIENVPRRAPSFVTKEVVSSTRINLAWLPLLPQDVNGVLLGYKVLYKPSGSSLTAKYIDTTDITLNLTNLLSYTQYDVQVLAYTRIGDGQPSEKIVLRTREDIPSEPRSLSVQSIQNTGCTLTWLPPRYPNAPGDIKYNLSYYGTSADYRERVISEITQTNYNVEDLRADTFYVFSVKAMNSKGESQPASTAIKTVMKSAQNPPSAILQFRILNKTSNAITLMWARATASDLPVRNYTVSMKTKGSASYQKLDLYIPGTAESATVSNLLPSTEYSFKLAASNDAGNSPDTPEIAEVTLTAIPSSAPNNINIVPRTPDSMSVTWQLPDQSTWNSPVLLQTRIWYSLYSPTEKKSIHSFDYIDVPYPLLSRPLEGLKPGATYEIRLSCMNINGTGIPSSPHIVYAGVAVPVAAPSQVKSSMVNDREINVTWQPLSDEEINGQLLGYKVYYLAMRASVQEGRFIRDITAEEYDLVAPDSTSHVLKNLKIFTEYKIEVTAYNIAGDGPRSAAVIAITDQGLPGPPGSVIVEEVTLNRVNVSWNEPADPNGNITDYIIKYYLADVPSHYVYIGRRYHHRIERRGIISSSHMVTSPQTHDILKLERNTTYNISVQAITSKGEGESRTYQYSTGPHSGVPPAPIEAQFSYEEDGVLVKWNPEGSPYLGYVIEGLGGLEWEFLLRKDGSSSHKTLLQTGTYPSLKSYSRFKVSLYNKFGVGEAKEADETVPFYKTWWFLVIIALAALLIIVTVLSVLCCYCFRMRAKLAEAAYEQDMISADSEYNTYSMQQTFSRSSTRGSKYRSEPPRPSPGAVLYANDDVPPRYDDSSVTEKCDLTSDEDDDESKGKLDVTDSSDDDIDKNGGSSITPSYNNYQYGGSHYASSGPVQQSWQNSYRGRNGRNMYSYTDSEAESTMAGPSYRPSNSSRNNSSYNKHNNYNTRTNVTAPDKPGSRAPLQNFSSFV